MMNYLCLALVLVLWPGQTQRKSFEDVKTEAARQAPQADAAEPQMGSKDRDPFYQNWTEFEQASAAWQNLDDQLEDSLSGVSPCDARAAVLVGKVKDSAFKAINAQSGYFRSWSNFASQNIQGFRQAMQSRQGLRREIELTLADLDRQRADLTERKRALEAELRSSGTASDGKEMQALDKLMTSTAERAANFKQALSSWDEAGRNGAMTIDAADALRGKVIGYLKLIESSAALYQAYYTAVESRLSLKCWRNELQPQAPVIRKPSFLKEGL